jgi:hypothetical protein
MSSNNINNCEEFLEKIYKCINNPPDAGTNRVDDDMINCLTKTPTETIKESDIIVKMNKILRKKDDDFSKRIINVRKMFSDFEKARCHPKSSAVKSHNQFRTPHPPPNSRTQSRYSNTQRRIIGGRKKRKTRNKKTKKRKNKNYSRRKK